MLRAYENWPELVLSNTIATFFTALILFYHVTYFFLQFIAHSFSQLMINHEVYRMFPQWKNIRLHFKYVIMLVVMVLFPVWTCSYLFFPNSHLTQLLRTPLAKFMVFMGSYHVFVALLVASAFQSDHDFLKVSITGKSFITY